MIRIGQGYDVHALVPGRALIVGGVKIPYARGLLGHSDADVLLHAITDALLGAAALGDIGRHFPDSDERWRGADSRALLRHCRELATARGYAVGNCDLVVVCERPRLAPHVALMRACIADDLLCAVEDVSVKATTSERLGFTGREEGIAAQALVMLYPGPDSP